MMLYYCWYRTEHTLSSWINRVCHDTAQFSPAGYDFQQCPTQSNNSQIESWSLWRWVEEIADVCVLSVGYVETLKCHLMSFNSLCRYFLYVVSQQLVLFCKWVKHRHICFESEEWKLISTWHLHAICISMHWDQISLCKLGRWSWKTLWIWYT